jgi:ketosteroid isomerase-like protein
MRPLLALLVWSVAFFGISQDKVMDELINQWHQDAASAAFSAYFSATTEDFIFLGTAPQERWNKTDFQKFCKPYFDKGTAWDFKPSNRKWTYSEDGNTAWFDEDLATWMEACRGTGICVKEGGDWKIAYYNLHVLIENEKIQEFITLRKKK